MQAKNGFFLSVTLMSIYSTGCANKETVSNTNHIDSLAPVETKSPNSDYKPAFSGQTRIRSVKTTTSYNVEKIAAKLGSPFAIVTMAYTPIGSNPNCDIRLRMGTTGRRPR